MVKLFIALGIADENSGRFLLMLARNKFATERLAKSNLHAPQPSEFGVEGLRGLPINGHIPADLFDWNQATEVKETWRSGVTERKLWQIMEEYAQWKSSRPAQGLHGGVIS